MALDPRLQDLTRWIARVLGDPGARLEPASDDASFRRYFRVWLGEESRIAMDAPPEAEDSRPFVRVAGLLRDAGVHAPEILHADLERGFLLLTDLGSETYLDVLDEDNADALFSDALDALLRWQQASKTDVLPPYDRGLLQQELDLYPDWYVARHLRVEMSESERRVWEQACDTLIESALEQPRVYVHRDYMPRNLMVSTPNPGIIDFQDAVFGPVSYDVVSLFRDAFISWDESRVSGWLEQYWTRGRAAGVCVHDEFEDFRRAADRMGFQRHLKVMGIFVRLHYRDGKSGYLEDTPRFLDYLLNVGRGYPDMHELWELLQSLEHRSASR